MELKCHICGRSQNIMEWTKEYEQAKRLQPDRAYICPQCQDKIRAEALDETP